MTPSRATVDRWIRHARRLAPVAEGAAGFMLFAVPIPEPVTEALTDVAGIGLMADAARRAWGRR